MAELLDYSERLMRDEIARLPAGLFAAEDFLDDDGFRRRPASRIRVKIALDPERRTARVDFTGTIPQCGGSVNAVYAIT